MDNTNPPVSEENDGEHKATILSLVKSTTASDSDDTKEKTLTKVQTEILEQLSHIQKDVSESNITTMICFAVTKDNGVYRIIVTDNPYEMRGVADEITEFIDAAVSEG